MNFDIIVSILNPLNKHNSLGNCKQFTIQNLSRILANSTEERKIFSICMLRFNNCGICLLDCLLFLSINVNKDDGCEDLMILSIECEE